MAFRAVVLVVALGACGAQGSAGPAGPAGPVPRAEPRRAALLEPTLAPPREPAPATPAALSAVSPAASSSAAAVRRVGAYANVDPEDDFVVGPPAPLDDCAGELARAGIAYRAFALPVHTEKQKRGAIVCGAPDVVVYLRGPAKIAYNAPPVLTCSMALALASFERVVQEEAERTLHSAVVRIDQLGTYSCRQVAAYPGTVSEHSYANALDIGRFVLKDGRSVEVLRDFDRTPLEPTKAAGRFLRQVSRRAHDEDVFSHVLTPFFDATHRNHFHLDLARYRTDGTR